MADRMLQSGTDLSEGLIVADRHEHRVIAEAPVAARGPDQYTIDAAIEGLGLAVVRPRDRQRAGEVCRWGGIGLGCFRLSPDPFHGAHPVAVPRLDRKSTRLNSSHMSISYAVF